MIRKGEADNYREAAAKILEREEASRNPKRDDAGNITYLYNKAREIYEDDGFAKDPQP